MGCVSDGIVPRGGSFDAAAMGRGEPGLPAGFTWRGVSYDVTERLEQWKHSERERGRAGGELYLRRHYYRLKMSDGSIWTVYFIRQPQRSGSAKARWFLYSVEGGEGEKVEKRKIENRKSKHKNQEKQNKKAKGG